MLTTRLITERNSHLSEMALRVAGLAHCNLVLVSSIFPPGCKVLSKEEGLKTLQPGEIVFAVYDRESTNEPNRQVAASVGVAIPAEPAMHEYLSEHHSCGETAFFLARVGLVGLLLLGLGTSGVRDSTCSSLWTLCARRYPW